MYPQLSALGQSTPTILVSQFLGWLIDIIEHVKQPFHTGYKFFSTGARFYLSNELLCTPPALLKTVMVTFIRQDDLVV